MPLALYPITFIVAVPPIGIEEGFTDTYNIEPSGAGNTEDLQPLERITMVIKTK